jgi:hypothetical protein
MSKSVKIVIISLMVVILGVLIGVCIKLNSGKTTNNNSTNDNGNQNGNVLDDQNNPTTYDITYVKVDVKNLKVSKKKSDDLTNKIDIIQIFFHDNEILDSGELQIYGKNNNSVPVDYKAELILYDKDGYVIDYISSSKIVLANHEFAISLNLSSTVKYASYALEYEANKVNSEYIMFNDIKHTSAEADDYNNILIKFKNTASEVIDSISFSCLLYKDGELVGASSTFNSGVRPSETAESTCYTSYYKIDFNQYKVILSSAYNYTNETSKW